MTTMIHVWEDITKEEKLWICTVLNYEIRKNYYNPGNLGLVEITKVMGALAIYLADPNLMDKIKEAAGKKQLKIKTNIGLKYTLERQI